MKLKHLLFYSFLLCTFSSTAQLARIQFINNCADAAHNSLDVYLDGALLVNDLNFRNASPQLMVPFTVSVPINIGVADQHSNNVNDTFVNLNTQLSPIKNYVIVINGIHSTSGYSPSPKMSLDVFDGMTLNASTGETDLIFINGSTDAPVMDIRNNINIVGNDLAYRNFSSKYADFQNNKSHIIRLTNTTGAKVTHTYRADFTGLNLTNKTAVVLTSGFINPANNSNGEPFGLWMAVPQGGQLIQLDTSAIQEPIARVQMIHNSPDTAVETVDIYTNGKLMVDSLEFRHSTTYMDMMAGNQNFTFAKAGTTETIFKATPVSLDSASTNILVLYGIHDSSANYFPSPTLTLGKYGFAREEAPSASNASLLFMHSATDIPTPDITAGTSTTPFVPNMSYGQFTNYLNGVTSPGAGNNYVIKVDTGNSNTLMHKYFLPFDALNMAGKSATILLSGFNDTAKNSGGANFGLWMALPQGGAMHPLAVEPVPPGNVSEFMKNAAKITVSPNPATEIIRFNFSGQVQHLILIDITGKTYTPSITTSNNEVVINTGKLTPGIYHVAFQSADGQIYYSKFSKL